MKNQNLLKATVATLVAGAMGLAGVGSAMADTTRISAEDLAKNGFAEDEAEFISKLRQIKKQGYYISKGELHPEFSSISVPVRYSSKEAPWAFTVLASTNRFEFIDTQKIVEMLKRSTDLIEQQALQIETDIHYNIEAEK